MCRPVPFALIAPRYIDGVDVLNMELLLAMDVNRRLTSEGKENEGERNGAF
jgi:hypothetical protein